MSTFNNFRLIIEDVLSTVFKLFLFYRFLTWYGFLFGFPFCILLFCCYRRMIFELFKIVPFSPYDICFISSKIQNRFNIIGTITLSNFNPEKMKVMIIERAMKKLKRFRLQLIYKFFNYYWKEVSIEAAISRIIICPHISTNNEFEDILNKELTHYLDVDNELPYVIKLIPYGDGSNKGLIMFHFDHLLSDGLGVISLICGLSDDYSPDFFPSIMLNYKEDSIIKVLIEWITFPIYGPYALFLMFFTNSGKNSFRTSKYTKKTFNYSLGKPMPLSLFNTNRKKFQMTFNQAIISAISLSCKNICNMKGFNSNKWIKVMMPVGRKRIPSSIEKVRLSNEAKFIFINVPLIESGSEFNLVSQNLTIAAKNETLNNANLKWANIIARIFSFRVIDFFGDLYCRNVDLVLSNIPGPTKELYYEGSRIEEINPIITPGRGIIFIILMTYNNSFHVNISIDDKLEIDAKDMLDRIEKALHDYFLIDEAN